MFPRIPADTTAGSSGSAFCTAARRTTGTRRTSHAGHGREYLHKEKNNKGDLIKKAEALEKKQHRKRVCPISTLQGTKGTDTILYDQ